MYFININKLISSFIGICVVYLHSQFIQIINIYNWPNYLDINTLSIIYLVTHNFLKISSMINTP